MNLLKRFFMFVVITTVSIFTLIGCSFSADKKPLSIEMESEIWAGVEYDLVVNITAGDASSVEWSIDNGKVATFQNGKLIGLEEGSFNLTAKLGEHKDVCHIVVKEAAVYNVSYVLFGGSENAEEPLVRTVYEYTEATTLTSPVKEGYVFQGYYTNESFEGEPITSISGEVGQDITLYAKWEVVEYTTSYDLAGGKLPEGVVLPEVRTIDSVTFTLPELTKEGYNFVGWFTADDKEVKYVGSENLHIDALYAKFEAIEYEITYELNGGTNSDSNPSKYTCEQKVEFAAPSRFGYKFVGWEVEGKQVEGIEAGSMGAVNAVAKWEVAPLSVEFELNGGALADGVVLPTSRTVEDAPYVLPTELSKLGHNFIGWFDNAECKGEKITQLDETNVKVSKFYAGFEEVRYNISYELNGGANDAANPDSYLYGIAVELKPATKEHYEFVEWQLNGVAVEEVAAGTIGEVKLVAVWKAIEYTVSIDSNDGTEYREPMTLDEFADMIVKDFNSTGKSDAKVTTKNEFKNTSHPNIKYVFADAAMLAKYKWFFEFLAQEMKAAAETNGLKDYLNVSVTMLEDMAAGDVNAVNADADARTAIRWLIEGLINERLSTGTGLYNHLMVDYSKEENVARFIAAQGSGMPTVKLTVESELPTISRENYEFLGWYENGVKVEKISGETTLVAEWKAIEYDVELDFAGGQLEGVNLDTFATELIKDFNSTGKSDAKVTTKNAFKDTSHPNIKYVFADAEMLAKYKWFFQFAIEEMTKAAELNGKDDYLADTVAMLEAMINGDTTAAGLSSNADERTAFRWWVEGLLNERLSTGTGLYNQLMIDYSKAENMARFEEALAAPYAAGKYTVEDKLFTLVREGYIFQGWFNEQGEKVESVKASQKLVAKWEIIKFEIEYELNEGSWAEGQEGVTQFDWGTVVTLPTPVREGYEFLGWIENFEYVTEIENKDYVLVAKWKDATQTGYEVIFDLNGGSWGKDLSTFADELIKDFNSTGKSDAKVTTKTEFKATSHPNIKYVFAMPEMLAKYKWFFEFAVEEITLAAGEKWADEEIYKNTMIMLNGMIAGDTNAVNINDGGNARTAFRYWVEGLLNEKLPTGTGSYDHLMVDYSNAENMSRFMTVYTAASQDVTFTAKDVLPTPVKENNKFLGWAHEGVIIEQVRGNWKLVAQWLDYATVKYSISYELGGGSWKEGETPVTEFGWNEEVTLLEPVKEGYKFLGWYEDKQAVSSIGNKDYTLVAKWEEEINEDEAKTLYVDPKNPEHYATLAEALEAARTGDTIVMAAGLFEPAEITKGIKLLGANAGINPNRATRGSETIFTKDLIVSANNVTIDGIELSLEGRIVGNSETGASNLTITNVLVSESTTNPGNAYSSTAPITLFTNVKGVYFENITLSNLRYEKSVGRPMILYGAQIVNINILNSVFDSDGSMSNYNDGIKLHDPSLDGTPGTPTEFGVKGDVIIKGNQFIEYYQYPIWFNHYQEGNYVIENNLFKDCGQTAASHCAVRFQKYGGAVDGKVTIDFNYNTVQNAYSLIRFDAAASRTADNTIVHANYNKLLNCAATYYVNNKLTFAIDATNNYYSVAPTADKFLNATWKPYFAKESDIPKYVDEENSVKIDYVLNGGTLVEGAEEYYNKLTGMSTIIAPTYENHVFLGWYYNDKLVTSLEAGIEGDIQLVAKWREDALYVGEGDEDWIYPTIADALAVAKAGDVIIIMAGEYAETLSISVPNLTIKGPNAGVNAVNGSRVDEAVIKGVITLSAKASGITFDGLAFTGNAKILYNEAAVFTGFTFQNNKVYDTTVTTMDWSASNYDNRYVLPAFIQFTNSGSSSSVELVEIFDNSFVNVSEINILLNRSAHVSVDGNLFKDFGVDAIRTEGGYVYGVLSFTNNVFEQTKLGSAGNGIFLYSVAGSSKENRADVIIEGNKFVKLGKNYGGVFTGAVSAYRFQENLTTFTIKNNIFDHCYDYLYLRNNGGSSANWFCTVENNQFLGLPTNQYYGSYGNGDSQSTNPHLAIFTSNYYEDNDGKVITDLSAYAQYFKHMASYGTALEAKPEFVTGTKVEFWEITYELNNGQTYDSFTYLYNSFNDKPISLPKLTLVNHQFMGWLLNGELISEIPADARGDLHLVADFSVLEGELYDITFVNEKEVAVWPSRAAVGREEIIAELMSDLYEWAQSNGETRSFADYEADIKAKIAAYSDIKLRNTALGNYPDEEGSTEYFFNVPKYYQKWNEFFAIFNEAMIAVNSGQIFYSDTYAAMVRLAEFIAWGSKGQGYFTSFLGKMCAATKVPQEIPTQYRGGQILELPQLSMENGLEFLGWYDNPEFTGEAITSITVLDTGDKTFYAKWAPEIKAEKFEINKVTEMLLFTTHQFVWSVTPDNTTDKSVEFFSSNEAVATVSSKGLLTALSLGTTTITVKVYGNRNLDLVFDVTVYSNDYIDASYAEESYARVNETVQLFAQVVKKDGTTGGVNWTSATPEIATVDGNGLVTALRPGQAKIVATDAANPELSVEFFVTVLEENTSEALDFIINSHEDNIFTRYNLGIGSGIPEYYKDIFGSVSKLLYNYNYQVDTSRKDTEVNNKTGDYYLDMTSVEFITVHYTGNMSKGADGKANANYFVDDNAVSIHYTTGNDGIYQCLDHKDGAWHAGDSDALSVVGAFEWMPTGIMVGENDPQYPVFTISDDFYYEINGHKTPIEMAKPWDYKSRGTDHILNADGTISSQSNFGQSGFTGRTPESFINDMGLPFMIQDGQYYMGTTWWCYTQVYEGRICSTGGNRNSVGIESCVDKGSDLWYTWQITAQLVAHLMVELELDITRVRGHHFFSGKDCPQPMLANDCEIWNEFKALILAEYELITKYADYEITFESHNPDIIDNNGRVIAQPSETTCVSYTITLTKDGVSESVTLSSMVKGLYVDR